MFQISLVIVILFFNLVLGRNKAPLLDDDGTRTRNKAAECVFGKQVKELGSQWIPDLGVPIGVLYCMKCECVPLQKKRRIVARVQCRSIKNECPEPKCDEPVHLPGRCCKTCPGDEFNPDVIQDIVPQNVLDEEEKSTKHYAALLSGRSSLIVKNDYQKAFVAVNKNNVVATGRFTFQKKNLHYSFYVSDKAARPRTLQFVDNEGNILEEFQLSQSGGVVNSLYQNATRKICGVWRRLPRDYRRLLKQEKMFVVLLWGIKDQTEFSLSGQLMKYVALGTELFSSLLEPSPETNDLSMTGAGGTAIVSISTSVSPSIHIAVIFNGLFTVDEIAQVPINITLALDEKRYVILQERVNVVKPMQDLNTIELSSPVTPADLRLLTRGRLLLSVSSVSKPESLRLYGNVITKATCELFQATLASTMSDHTANPYGTSGLAWLYLNNEGSLVYNVQVDNLRPEQMPALITLVDVSTKRRTELEDLTPYFVDGWANGTVDKLSPKVLEPLYSGNLAVNVATQTEMSLIKGRLQARPVADARDAPAPFLLKRENYTLPTSAVGLAWISVDNDCHIHYDVSISGIGSNDKFLELHLDLLPMLAPGAPVISRFLDEFQGNQVEGSPVNSLTKEEINRLDSGVGFLKIKDKDSKITLLAATVRHVIIPTTCRPPYTDNNVPTLIFDQTVVEQSGDCFYEGKFYQEEAQWTSAADACTMCFCQNGVAKCDTMVCPETVCPNLFKVKVPGECCPICSNTSTYMENSSKNTTQKCIFNGKPYSPGSKFHPFLIPSGFDSCTDCVCDPLYLEIKCTRNTNEKMCCKSCQKVDYTMNGTYHADDQTPQMVAEVSPKKKPATKSAQQVLAEGGCRNLYNPKKPYLNGSEYHPSIDSLGEYKCVTCKCQNGNQICKRQHCDKTTCEKMFKLKRKGLSVNSAEYCCNLKECRKYRHKKNHSANSPYKLKSLIKTKNLF